MRRIAVVTGSRAEYGLLRKIIRGIHEDPSLELQLIVTGSHLCREFGSTVEEIELDHFPIIEKVEMQMSSDSEEATAVSMGIGMTGFAGTYARLKPDMLLVLGDRFETFSAVAAAVPFRIPVAHIHGGESTNGVMDELFRHGITKMSALHFAAAEIYARRIVQMGEDPRRVYCFGAPGLDGLDRLRLIEKRRLLAELGLPSKRPLGVVTFHPATLEATRAEAHSEELLSALKAFPKVFWVFTKPNQDPGGRMINRMIEGFVNDNPKNSKLFSSLGRLRYLSLLKYARVMAGNSSSGILEAPSFSLPVVNVGGRQSGRLRAANVIDAPARRERIAAALKKALSKDFRASIEGVENPYCKGSTCRNIVEVLKTVPLKGLHKKRFRDA